MKTVKRKRLAGILGCLLALSLIFSLTVTVPVLAVPQIHHQFWGQVTIEGEPAAQGTAVSAEIDGVVYASTTVDADGRYGYIPLFKVLADDPETPEKEGGVNGDTIEFYVAGVPAGTYHPFEIAGRTELNLPVGVDITPPTVVGTTPEDGATNEAIDVVVSATFDEAIDEATLVFTLDSVAGTVAYDSATKTATFTPAANLDYEVTYTASIQASDLAGNPMAEAKVWSFTTRAAGLISFTVTLSAGWNLLSTPIKLEADSDALEQIFDAQSLANIEGSYRWEAVSQQWVVPTGYELSPLEAVYLKVKADASATAEFITSQELSELPSRELQPGLNLIGSAPALEAGVFPAMPLDQALISIADAEGGLRGYTMVVSPEHNQTAWAYALGGEIKDLIPFKGYWVVMENADTLYGFSITPIE